MMQSAPAAVPRAEKDVFISYSRGASSEAARVLYEQLGGSDGIAFLDTEDIAEGEFFPRRLADAILGSKIFVAFVDDVYFRRWICLRELRTALAPFDALQRKSQLGAANLEAALGHIVVALPATAADELLDALPPCLRITNWPKARATASLARLVHQRLGVVQSTIGQHLETTEERPIRDSLLVEAALPPPQRLPHPHFPHAFPPSIHARFVGRADDLFRIHFALATLRGEPARSAALSGSVQGGGGFGKTRLALEYAWRFGATHFPGGVFCLMADQTESGLQRQFHAMLRELDPATPELHLFLRQGRDARKELGVALARADVEKPVLFIVDNVPHDNSESSPRPLADYCPALGAVTVLVTTRLRIAESHVLSLNIDVLRRSASVDLLAEGIELLGDLSEGEWWEIAAWVGDLPLALEVLNSSLRFAAITPAELLAKARSVSPTNEIDRQMKALHGQVPAGSLRGVTEALALSYDALKPEVRRAARMIAWFAAEPIPVELFRALGKDVDTSEVRSTLVGRSFLSSPGAHEQGVDLLGTMHRVTADYIRIRIRTPRADLQRLCVAIVEVMPPNLCADPRQWPLMNACLPHAEGLFWRAIGEPTSIAQSVLAKLMERSVRGLLRQKGLAENLIEVGLCARNLRYSQQLYDDAQRCAEAMLQFAERTYGPDDERLVLPILSLADVLREKGSDQEEVSEARRLEERAIKLCKGKSGKEHELALIALNNLAVTLAVENKPKEAISILEKVLTSQRKQFGEQDRETITTMHNLASSRWKAGDRDGARELMKRTWELYYNTMGEAHPDTLRSLGWLASMEPNALKRLALRSKVVEMYRRPDSCGDNHPATLRQRHDLALEHNELGNYEQAAKLFKDVLLLRRKVLGDLHPHTLLTQYWLARVTYNRRKYNVAAKAFEAVLLLYERSLGSQHKHTLAVRFWLARSQWALGKRECAEQLFEEVLRLENNVYGKANPTTLVTVHNLARIRYELGENDSALELLQEVLAARRRALGERHEETLRSASALGEALLALNRHEEAKGLLESTLKARLEVLGPDHEDLAFTYRGLGQTYRAIGLRDDGVDSLSSALSIRRRKLGPHAPLTTVTAWDLFEFLEQLGSPKAPAVFEEHLRWLLAVRPSGLHPDQRKVLGKLKSHLELQRDLGSFTPDSSKANESP